MAERLALQKPGDGIRADAAVQGDIHAALEANGRLGHMVDGGEGSRGGEPHPARNIISPMTEPRRVLIDWDWGGHGIWRVLTKQEMEAPAPPGRWSGAPPRREHERARPWSDLLTSGVLDDLQAWNDAWDVKDADVQALERRGQELALRVQLELGVDGWEVLYMMDGRVHRVHPPGSWPAVSWQQDLLGYAPRDRGDEEG